MSKSELLRWLLPTGLVLTPLRNAASQPMGLWDYLMNGTIITVAVILWVALKR